MSPAPSADIVPFGESAWLARFALPAGGDRVALALYAGAIAAALRSGGEPDVVAGLDSVALRFAPTVADAARARERLEAAIARTPFADAPVPARTVELPVAYGGDDGPDFDDLCARSGLSGDELVAAHTAPAYCVLMLGFAPGFAYLGPLDPRLDAPRLETPRARVAAGSVAVAGGMTGIYSLGSPGGWRIIGRTPARLFDAGAASPFVLEAGMVVRFVPIARAPSRPPTG